jgi:hypothetical protein
VISVIELTLLLNGKDRNGQLDALESLFDQGLVTAVIDGDLVTGIRTTPAGDNALSVVTLPTASA